MMATRLMQSLREIRKVKNQMSIKTTFTAFAAVLTVCGGLGFATSAQAGSDKPEHGKTHEATRQAWSFGGLFGAYDKAQLRRGYQIYSEVCSACHGLKLLSYRNLMQEGGPAYTKKEVKALIAELEVPAEPNDEGEIFKDGERIMRPAILPDRFISPYPNPKAAMAANDGALPPDLSVMAKARALPHHDAGEPAANPFSALTAGVAEYFGWIFGTVRDIATQYQEGGPDYIYALMIGYEEEAPKGQEIPEGKNFNYVFPGHAISMAPPLSDETVEYTDGTKPTLDQHARDISAFLMWAAEPHLNARKSLGLKVLIYLLIFSGMMYAVKRAIWRDVKH